MKNKLMGFALTAFFASNALAQAVEVSADGSTTTTVTTVTTSTSSSANISTSDTGSHEEPLVAKKAINNSDADYGFANSMSTNASTHGSQDHHVDGIRVTLLKPFIDITVFEPGYEAASSTIDSTGGIALGYAYLPLYQLGWTSNIGYIQMNKNGGSNGLARVDANLAYTFHRIFSAKAGGNVSKLTKEHTSSGSSDAWIGWQASVGLQFSEYVGFDIGYVHMAQRATNYGRFLDIEEQGFEASLHATF